MADTVVYYGSTSRPGFFEAFEEETGITVNAVTAPGYQSVSRFQTEESNGNHSADVLNSVSQVFLRDDLVPYFAEINMWEEYKDVYPQALVDKVENTATENERSKMLPVTTNNYMAAYSTSRTDSPLESWDGILQSQFEDSVGAPTFTMSSMYWIMRQEMSEEDADQYFTDLANLGTQFAGQSTSAFTEAIVSGQSDVAFGVAASTAIAPFLEDGAPIAPVTPDWTGSTVSPIAISKNAPHPEAAQRLVEFMISEQGQKANANYGAGRAAIRADVPHGNKQIREAISDMDVYPMFVTPETKDRVIEKANSLLPLS
ncbi:ABC transporter substrate-binding protein [Halobium palmae]|uniref:ABC transporter substrate-binding protein n=1 Tax=Halobium palmae TaxID=1776492 RepID=A0ABD5RX83_9EURY